MPTTNKDWVDILSALLTPVIAFFGSVIAFQQYKINKSHLQHELYERRLRVYKAVQAFLLDILRSGAVDYQRISVFYAEASEAAFLFEKSIQEYVDNLFEKAVEMRGLDEKMYPLDGSPGLPTGEERTRVAIRKSELLKWFTNQFKVSKGLFGKHMGIK